MRNTTMNTPANIYFLIKFISFHLFCHPELVSGSHDPELVSGSHDPELVSGLILLDAEINSA
jgi:hypothetical protein